MPRQSRPSRQSVSSTPIHTLEHDAVAVALQEALGARVLLIRAIGEGGMGRVYLARDPQLKRFVAVKVLVQSQGADAESHARFRREAQAIAAVSHPNVVSIYGVGELPDGTPYFIMQYVGGGSMAERLASSGPLPLDVAESVIGDVAAALAAAHRRGIVHRDVKPANVLWDEDGERATVSDFGIATLQSGDGDSDDIRITATGMAVGSPQYMSPEQLLTEPVTPKSDIYALGLLGYELLTAHGPYKALTPSDIVAAHLRDKPRRLSDARTDIPESLQDLLLRCLAKDPDERPTAEEVMQAMTPGAADALEWPPPGLERARAALWRLISSPAVGIVLLLLPLVFLVWLGRAGVDEIFGWPLVVAAVSLVGFAAFARAGFTAWRIVRAVSRAALLGYGWGTLLEVMSDRRGDTGSLIAGTREYAELFPAERARLRVLRVVTALSFVLAAPVALVVAIIALTFRGGDVGGETFFLRAVLTAVIVLGGIGVVSDVVERVRLAGIRRRRSERPRQKNEGELAPAWYAAFERSREGQPFGPGRPVKRIVTAVLVAAGTSVVLFCAVIVLFVSVLTVTGQLAITAMGAPTPFGMVNTEVNAITSAYRLPPDGRTTPVEAGEALLEVASTTNRRKPSPLEQRASSDYPRWNRVVPPATMFPKPSVETPWTSAAIRAAANGLSPDQRLLLQQASAHPARDEFSRAARASAVDVYGALLKLPLPATLGAESFPIANLYGVREAAEAHSALVALDVADNRPVDAERHAREIISVGDLMTDTPFMTDNLMGQRILTSGVSALEALYVATGREREARELLDSVVTTAARANPVVPRSNVPALQRAMRNRKFSRGTRMDFVLPVLMRACADPKQLIFGVEDSYASTLRYARDSIARFPGERAYVEALGNMLRAGQSPASEFAPPSGTLMWMARMVDGIVGGKRFQSCAAMETQMM